MVQIKHSLFNRKYSAVLGAAGLAFILALLSLFSSKESIRIIGITVLVGNVYGIINDMFACRECIEYFTVRHFYDGQNLENRLLRTLNPTLNAIAWGIVATWHVCAYAGSVLAFFARKNMRWFTTQITSTQLLPYLALSALVAIVISHFVSRIFRKSVEKNPQRIYYNVPLELQARWIACESRNTTGYISIFVCLIILCVLMILSRKGIFVL